MTAKSVPELSTIQKTELTELFGEYVNLDKRERHYYNHDIGALPPLLKKVIGKTDPAAVVKIRTEEDAVKLLEFANRHKIPVFRVQGHPLDTGGMPTKGGIVADVTLLNRVISIDPKDKKQSCRAGFWEKTGKKTQKTRPFCQGDPIKPLPQLWGLVCQSGAGYGSYEFGWGYESMEKSPVSSPTEK
jgi:FAD/FMN-containing dehydrogenase